MLRSSVKRLPEPITVLVEHFTAEGLSPGLNPGGSRISQSGPIPYRGSTGSPCATGARTAAIAAVLVVSEGAVEKHVANIFLKLGLPVSESDNRGVLAVLRYLES